MRLLLAGLYAVGLYGAYVAETIGPRRAGLRMHRVPSATLWLMLAIAVAAMLQFFHPAVLPLLERDTARMADGEWWRFVTALFVQDGGPGGVLFNLASLFFVGSVAEWRWGKRRWLTVVVVGALVGEMVALVWQPVGAGNSLLDFSLAGSVAVGCLPFRERQSTTIWAIIAIGADVWLLLLKDVHGAAALAGMVSALVMLAAGRSRSRITENASLPPARS